MLDCENIMLIGLVSIIVIIIVLMYKKTNQITLTPSSSNILENFKNDMDKDSFDIRELSKDSNSYKDKYEDLKKYMEIQGMYHGSSTRHE